MATRPPENAIELTLEDVAAMTPYVDEAGVDTTEPLAVWAETDTETAVTLEIGAGTETVTVSPDDGMAAVTLCERGGASNPGNSGAPASLTQSNQRPAAVYTFFANQLTA